MAKLTKHYIDGAWVDPVEDPQFHQIVDPASEDVIGEVVLGSAADVDRAVTAAKRAFSSWSRCSRAERIDLLMAILAEYQKRAGELAQAVTSEMGSPAAFAQSRHVPIGAAHIANAARILETYAFEEDRGSTLIRKEPIGVCGFITPWNWPLNQITCKLAPALATGCTTVLKPAELSALSAQIFAEILDTAGTPAGVFNMVYGNGAEVGAAIARHRHIDMVSFTGSTRAGVDVAVAAAPTVKRVAQELGGKSPNIILDDEVFEHGVSHGVTAIMSNSGQSCNAPTRMLVPAHRMDEAMAIAGKVAGALKVGDPKGEVDLGPIANKRQFDNVQRMIQVGIDEGATLVAGGPGLPDGLERGYFAKPTVFGNVSPDMTISREEIFGPVLSIIPYDSLDEAIRIANDTEYGLAAYAFGADLDQLRQVASQLQAGQVILNGRGGDLMAPFGGYKRSGNGREWGDFAFTEFLEVKAVLGFGPVQA